MKIKTYLINLDDSTERLCQASQQLQAAGVSFERVPAFDGRNIQVADIKEYDEKASVSYMGRGLKGGELGCYFSHVACVERFLASDADYAMVLEDDMTAPDTLLASVTEILRYTENQAISWYLMNIGANKHKISTLLRRFASHILYKAHYFPMTTTGIIWSRQGAEAFWHYTQTHAVFCPVDNFFRYWLTDNNKGLSVYPPLTPPSGADSDINYPVAKKTNGRNRHPLYGLIKQRRLWGDKLKALRHKYLK
ncbi:MAG: glycosyl transferase [Gammaproteobacteria bacterium]|nr:MAG: glycosyl transferase [Gammaproteobacteria bacterium]